MTTCNTNVIQLQDVTLASMTNNGNGTHSFDPGDGVPVTFSTDNVANASFNASTRLLTLTLASGGTITVTIPSAVSVADPTPSDGLVDVTIAGVTYTLSEGFTEVSGPNVDDNYLVDTPDGNTFTFPKAVFRKVLVPATPTSTGTLNDIAFDSNYAYICVATNTWRRFSLGTW